MIFESLESIDWYSKEFTEKSIDLLENSPMIKTDTDSSKSAIEKYLLEKLHYLT